jgi:hypothetical protein
VSRLATVLAIALGSSAGLALGACGEDGGSGPQSCLETAADCDGCPAHLYCEQLGDEAECYTPCDTVEDCADCEVEQTCTVRADDRMVCDRF